MKKNMKICSAIFIIISIVLSGCADNTSGQSGETQQMQPMITDSPVLVTTSLPDSDKAPQIQPVSTVTEQSASVGDDLPVSRAVAAKMIALAYNDVNAIDSMDREITFTDTDPSKWYDKYINAVYVQEYMLGSGDHFMPEAPLTLQDAQRLIQKIDPSSSIKIQIDANNKDKPVSYALWIDFYKKVLEGLSKGRTINDVFGIEGKNLVVMATPGNNSLLGNWNMITDKGPYSYSGLNMDSYIDKEIRAFMKDGEIIAVISLVSQTPTIYNAYVVNNDDESLTIFSGGAERTYTYDNSLGDVSGMICDIRISGDNALDVVITEQKARGVVKKTSKEELDITYVYAMDENFKVYSITDGPVKWKSMKDITIGADIAIFFIKDGRACACVIDKKADTDKIRVAIGTTNFTGLVHSAIMLTATTDYTVSFGNDSRRYSAGEIINISSNENSELFGHNRIYVKPDSDSGRIVIKSISRNWPDGESPKYRGIIEVAKEGSGYTVVNEVGFEEYLYAVVPSEIPSSYGIDASKVQAVTARSYAYNQFYANRFHQYGANVDDSVSCQVYNNIPENETSITAVNETNGMCITYGGTIISANFFSTSSGMTASSGEVWASSNRQFPTASNEYLQAKKQYTQGDYGDLSVEENASRFFKTSDIDAYDSGFSWFRWNVEMTVSEITASINTNLSDRYGSSPSLIKTWQGGNTYRSRKISSIGKLVDLEVTKRGAGGNIIEMKITGTEATILVSTEYNVRVLIRPYQYQSGGREIVTYRHDGGESANYSIMPSAFYVMEKTWADGGGLASVRFVGGGNGHGVGMSQNGVKGMIDRGYSFNDILKHYFPGTEVKKVL